MLCANGRNLHSVYTWTFLRHQLAYGQLAQHNDTAVGVAGATTALRRNEVQLLEPSSFPWARIPVS